MGWERAVKAPTARKLQQAIGRLIRSETDRGVAIILDKRAIHFTDTISAKRTEDPVEDVNSFFENRVPEAASLQKVRSKRKGLQL